MSDYRSETAAMAVKMQQDLRAMLSRVDDAIAAPGASVRPHVGESLAALHRLRRSVSECERDAYDVARVTVAKRTDEIPSTGNVTPPGREVGLPTAYRNEHLEDANPRSSGVPMSEAEREQRREQALRGELKSSPTVAVSNVGDDGPTAEEADEARRLRGERELLPPKSKAMPVETK